MGKVIKATELWSTPVRLGERRRQALARALGAAAEDAALLEGSRARVVELALGMARRIVGRAVELEPGLLDEIYRRARDELGPLPPTAIRVHPADRARADIEREGGELGCVVIDDATVGRGGCRVSADGAEVDASIDALLEALGEALGGRRVG